MIGILPVHKPVGSTSHDIVQQVRRILNPKGTPKPQRIKVGHAGTLDPFAQGVLLVTIGRATKLERFLHAHLKTYEAVVQLGSSTTTDDPEGETLASSPVPILPETLETDLQAAFTGTIQQRPPLYSALKQGGEALYKKARRGESIQLPTRQVHIEQLTVVSTTTTTITLRIRVGSGTYIRALGRDIGLFLGTHAHLTQLTRTAIGPWSIRDCVRMEDCSVEHIRMRSSFFGTHLGLEEIECTHEASEALQQGRTISIPSFQEQDQDDLPHRSYLVVHGGFQIAIVERHKKLLQPRILLKRCHISTHTQAAAHNRLT